jgi:hypothetical protein
VREPRGLTDEEILSAIRDCHTAAMAAGEVRLTLGFYKQWRKKELARLGRLGQFRPIPAHHCVWKRFGGFQKAVTLAMSPTPATASCAMATGAGQAAGVGDEREAA